MSDIPHEVQLSLADFDRSQLPESQRDLQGDAFRSAVQDHLSPSSWAKAERRRWW